MILAACFLALTPSPPAHATDAHLDAWEAWQAEQVHEQWHECVDELHDLNGPYVTPPSVPPPVSKATGPRVNPPPAGVEQWRGLVAAIWPPEQVDSALRVLACESQGDPGAISPTDDWGLMQINRPTWETTYGPASSWLDPATNLRVALAIWRQGGWGWWTCGWAA